MKILQATRPTRVMTASKTHSTRDNRAQRVNAAAGLPRQRIFIRRPPVASVRCDLLRPPRITARSDYRILWQYEIKVNSRPRTPH